MAGQTTVEFLVRSDFRRKPGGDIVMANEYAAALANASITTTLLPLTTGALQRTPGTAHLFNVDRLIEFASAGRPVLNGHHRPLVVSPIHHPRSRVEYFENNVRSGALSALNHIARGACGRERMKHVIRTRSATGLREALSSDPRRVAGEVLRAARLVVVQADGERRGVEETFGISLAHNAVRVPNGVTVDAAVNTDGVRDIDVVVAGRIEERKNQVAVAASLGGTSWRVVFVGGTNGRSRRYTHEFHDLLRRHGNLEHRTHMPLAELRRLYARSRVCMSASYFEVVSLAELEAVAYGCQLVSATTGYLSEYLGDCARYLEPTSPAAVVREAIATSLECGTNHSGMDLVRSQYSLEASGSQLIAAYIAAGLV